LYVRVVILQAADAELGWRYIINQDVR